MRKAGRVSLVPNTLSLNAFAAFTVQPGTSHPFCSLLFISVTLIRQRVSVLPFIIFSPPVFKDFCSFHSLFFSPPVFQVVSWGSVRFHLGAKTLKEDWGNITGSHKWSGSYSGQWSQWILMHACISRLRTFQGRTNGLGNNKRELRSVGVPEASRETLKTFGQSKVLT